ncbi:MAG: multidrug transporter [Clostridiaceae bacterium]|nr:multidrug transporter [Clostridiaceae bacterium]
MMEQKKKRLLLDGFGTIEVVIIIAVLITIALLFRENIIAFARSLIDKVFRSSVINEL